MNTQLSRQDSALLKGVAIVAIVLHNFCHWLPGCVPENEYRFSVANTWQLVDCLRHFGPHVLLNLLSYLGHYGVPVFLFVSGYGLVCKYEQGSPVRVPVARFAARNALKLWRLMIPAIAIFYVVETLHTGHWRHGWDNIVYMLTFVANFLPDSGDSLLPRRDLLLGPWWYFSLTMQVYLLWRLCYYRRGRAWIAGSVAVSLAAQVVAVTLLADEAQTALDYLRYNVVGCLLPFALGVWTARYGLRVTPRVWAAAALLFVGGCFNVYLWMLTPPLAVVLLLPLVRIRARALRAFFQYVGGISAAMFALHPIVRSLLASPGREIPVYSSLLAYLVLTFAAAWALTLLLKRIPLPKF